MSKILNVVFTLIFLGSSVKAFREFENKVLEPNLLMFNGYDYLSHGDDWGGYSPYCISGTSQSPIDLINTTQEVYNDIHYFLVNFTDSLSNYMVAYYQNTTLVLQNSQGFGTIYAVNPDGGMWGYQAQWIKFRCESEHTFNGVHYPLEIQIQCQQTLKRAINPDYQTLVISLFFEAKSEQSYSPFLNTIIQANQTNTTAFLLDLTPLLNLTTSNFMEYWSYFGSNTEPYCSQTYVWYIMKQTYEASPDQLDFFYQQYYNQPNFLGEGNYRKVDATLSSDVQLFYFPANE